MEIDRERTLDYIAGTAKNIGALMISASLFVGAGNKIFTKDEDRTSSAHTIYSIAASAIVDEPLTRYQECEPVALGERGIDRFVDSEVIIPPLSEPIQGWNCDTFATVDYQGDSTLAKIAAYSPRGSGLLFGTALAVGGFVLGTSLAEERERKRRMRPLTLTDRHPYY